MLAAAALLAGCGGSAHSSNDGAAIFASACSSCHTLAPNPHPSPVGGTLSGYGFTEAQVASFTRVMPLRKRLTPRQIAAVSRFVVRSQQRSGGLRPAGG